MCDEITFAVRGGGSDGDKDVTISKLCNLNRVVLNAVRLICRWWGGYGYCRHDVLRLA